MSIHLFCAVLLVLILGSASQEAFLCHSCHGKLTGGGDKYAKVIAFGEKEARRLMVDDKNKNKAYCMDPVTKESAKTIPTKACNGQCVKLNIIPADAKQTAVVVRGCLEDCKPYSNSSETMKEKLACCDKAKCNMATLPTKNFFALITCAILSLLMLSKL